MPLVLSPITPSDTLARTRIRTLAIAHDRQRELNKPNTWHFQITDTNLVPSADSPGRVIAIAVWSLKNKGTAVCEHDAQPKPASPPPYNPPNLRLDALNSLLALWTVRRWHAGCMREGDLRWRGNGSGRG